MGKPIDSTSYTDIQGQRVYFCCDGCGKKLLADPDKYFKKAAADSILFENIQTTCPVTGEALESKDVYTDFEGRRVYFCCKKCQGKFAANPRDYLKKLDVPATSEKPAALDHGDDDHSHHDHH
jgi:YHS domain-containing protein